MKQLLMRVGAAAVVVAAVAVWTLDSPLVSQTLRESDVRREFGYITLRDGVKLSYVTYRPAREGRYPTLLEFSPYGVDGAEFEQVRVYLERGYAYAGVDIRGTSCSGGTLSMFDPALADDGAQVVEWVGTRGWSDGGVGMIGVSYPGHTQIFTASRQPKHLKAIAAGALTASGYREAWRPGGMFNYAFIGGWAFSSRDAAALRRAAWGDTDCDLEKARTGARGTFDEIRDHPILDEWWKARDLETYISKVNVPTLIVQAWQDHQTQISGALRLFRELNTPNKRILLQSGGHFAYRRPISREEWLRWMDRWLKGEANGIDKEPPVKVMWEVHDVEGRDVPNWTSTYASWPPPEVRPITLYLTADGKLSADKPGASADNGPRSYTYPMGTELVADNEQFEVRPSPAGTLTYRTAPMTEDTTILGFSQLTFYMSSQQKDTDVMVVLHDIDESGNTLYLQRDFLRASMRALDTARSTPEETLRAFTKVEELVPGRIYEMKLSIPPLGHVVRRGHALELAIMAPSHIAQPNWGFMIVNEAGLNTVYHSAQYPSSLTIPVLPGAKAQAVAPPCGAMERQPCRPAPRTSAAR